MRLNCLIKSDMRPVPRNHLPQIVGAFHKWLGRNNLHGKISLYSISMLIGGTPRRDHLIFENHARLQISSYDPDIMQSLIKGIQADPTINFGLEVSELILQQTPFFTNKEIFRLASPALVKKRFDNMTRQYIYTDPECDSLITETLKTKLRIAGISDDNINVRFLKDHPSARTKLIYYNSIGNKTSMCPIEITGAPEQIAFAWTVGVGNSTGAGFGALI